MACYSGPNPIKDEDRYTIWKWAKENGIDQGQSLAQVHDSINNYFYAGQAKPEWINDILSGRKTPFRSVANDLWRKQYNRRAIVQQADELSRYASTNPAIRAVMKALNVPRSVAVFGHGIVFPFTHAGDLVFNPSKWGTFIKGTLRSYRGALSSAYSGRILDSMSRDPMYDLALRSGVDVGPKSQPLGLIATGGGKTGFFKAAARSWDMLTVMRFELWKNQVAKFAKADMSEADMLDMGKNLAIWANHATGSGKGAITNLGGALFGPKLTQSKLNRLSVDPAQTFKTFANWKDATVGERAAAWTRFSGATQYVTTMLGFLAVNQGVLSALGQKDKINYSDPMKGDWMSFKGAGLLSYVPGLHTEIRTLGKILATVFMSKRELRGESKFSQTAKIAGQYGMGKLSPSVERPLEVGLGQNWRGQPLPWSKEVGTKNAPRMTYGEYAASIGPIPLEGPTGYVYDQLKKGGASSLDATQITKAIIIAGIGLPGVHIRGDYSAKK